MKRFVKNRLVWLTVGGAIGFTILTYLNVMYGWHWPYLQKKLFFLNTIVMWPWIAGALVSGSMEAPNPVIVGVGVFITYIIILGTLLTFCWFVHKQITKRRHF